jgi:preprotein translocase subunit YajC
MSAQGIQFFFFLAFLIIMYVFLIYPQRKRIKEHSKLIKELKVKDEILTVGGIYGKINRISKSTVTLEIASGVNIKITRNAVSKRIETE